MRKNGRESVGTAMPALTQIKAPGGAMIHEYRIDCLDGAAGRAANAGLYG
jgi:hypothetical protein